MTTVAYRSGIMAADSQATWDMGGSFRTHSKKIYEVAGCLIGICGDYYAAQQFTEWFVDGDDALKPDPASAGDFVAMIVDTKGKLFTANCFYTLVPEEGEYFAIGSGAPYALSALRLGLSAEKAIEHAIEFDIYSGGPVRTARLEL